MQIQLATANELKNSYAPIKNQQQWEGHIGSKSARNCNSSVKKIKLSDSCMNLIKKLKSNQNILTSSPSIRGQQVNALEIKSKLLFSMTNEVEPPPPKRQSVAQSCRSDRGRASYFPPLNAAVIRQEIEQNDESDSESDLNHSRENTKKQELIEKLDFFTPIKKSENKFNQAILRIKQVHKEHVRSDRQKNGVNIINFAQQRSLIQPKFMEEKGTMCITELWPEQMKQELINVNQFFDEKGQAVIQSSKLRMSKVDKDYTQRYQPRKMREKVDVQLKVQDDMQNMQLNSITPDYVIKSYGLQKEANQLKESLQKKKSPYAKVTRNLSSEQNKYLIKSHFRNNVQTPSTDNRYLEAKRSRKSTLHSNLNSSSEQENTLGDTAIDHQQEKTLNMSQSELKLINIDKNDSMSMYYNDSFSNRMNVSSNYRNQQIKQPLTQRKFIKRNSSLQHQYTRFGCEIESEYYQRQHYLEQSQDLKNRTFWKNFKENTGRIYQLIRIKGDCESVLENTLGIDSHLQKFDFDFNKKVDKLDRRIERYRCF